MRPRSPIREAANPLLEADPEAEVDSKSVVRMRAAADAHRRSTLEAEVREHDLRLDADERLMPVGTSRVRRRAQQRDVYRRAAHDVAAEPAVAEADLMATGAHGACHNHAVEHAGEPWLKRGADGPLL